MTDMEEAELPDQYECGCEAVERDEGEFEAVEAECPEHGEPLDFEKLFQSDED